MKNRNVFRIIIIVIASLSAILISEVIVCFFHLAPSINKITFEALRLTDNPVLEYEFIPWGIDGYQVINGDGLRDFHYSLAKPANTFRIAVLGDSVPYGQGNRLWESFPEVLEIILNQYLGSQPDRIEVINFSVPGYDISQTVESYSAKALAYNPDLVILSYCLNDPDPFHIMTEAMYKNMDQDQRALFHNNRAKAQFSFAQKSDLVRLIKYRLRAQKEYSWQEDMGMPDKANWAGFTSQAPYYYSITSKHWDRVEKALKKLDEETRLHGDQLILAILPILDGLDEHVFKAIHEKVQKEAQALKIPVVDLYEPLAKASAAGIPLKNHSIDNIHPNAKGHKVIGWTLAKELNDKKLIPYTISIPEMPVAEQANKELFPKWLETKDMTWAELGFRLTKQDKFQEAKRAFQVALKLNPNNMFAIKQLDLLKNKK